MDKEIKKIHDDATESMLQEYEKQKEIDNIGTFPIRVDTNMLISDEDRKLKLGWKIKEKLDDFPIWKKDSNEQRQIPSTEELKIGEEIIIICSFFAGPITAIYLGENMAKSGGLLCFLSHKSDYWGVWGFANEEAIKKINI